MLEERKETWRLSSLQANLYELHVKE